jgi:hypothetical protein
LRISDNGWCRKFPRRDRIDAENKISFAMKVAPAVQPCVQPRQ